MGIYPRQTINQVCREPAACRSIERRYGKFSLLPFSKREVSIFGKEKEFDLVNLEGRIVGDAKVYRYRGARPSAEFSTLSEYVWLMENLDKSSGER
ncbi:MAG: hypothetical protein QXF09_05865 [Nitrososphaerota archaeon]